MRSLSRTGVNDELTLGPGTHTIELAADDSLEVVRSTTSPAVR